jgi:outer membrane biosynthesis protein TonB
MTDGPSRDERRRLEFEQAERWLGSDPAQRRLVARALIGALVLHATVLVARMPNWGPDPVRVDAPQEQAMKIQFLKPPPPPPKAPERPPEPEKKRIPKPDPTPDEPEPVKPAPPPPPEPAPAATPEPAQPNTRQSHARLASRAPSSSTP